VADLKKKFHAKNKKYYPARQRFTLPPKEGQKSGEAVKDTATLESYNLASSPVLYFKDLGPQVSSLQAGVCAFMFALLSHSPRCLDLVSPRDYGTRAHWQSFSIRVGSLPQIDYSTVFFFEYLGPMLIYPLFFFFPQYLYWGQE
jgi:very-long-chain enoyl-CoA reductase